LRKNAQERFKKVTADASSRADGEGGSVKLVVRNDLPDDSIYGAWSEAGGSSQPWKKLLEDEVYHYHHKLILKEARVGGAWAWHQDYGYWYGNGCLFPDMGSCLIAIDSRDEKERLPSGGREVTSSGRMDHGKVGDQTGADPERVAAALDRLPLVYCELKPGSAVFFHANTLHRSDQNTSRKIPDGRSSAVTIRSTTTRIRIPSILGTVRWTFGMTRKFLKSVGLSGTR